MKVGVAYMNVHVMRDLEEELALAIDKRLWDKILSKTVKPLRS